MKDILYLDTFGKAFIPKRLRPNLRNYLFTAGINEVPYKFFGILFWITAIVTFVIYFSVIYSFLADINTLGVFIITLFSWFIIQSLMVFFIIMIVYFYLNMRIFNRVQELEKHLPDYLTLVSTNLKGGLSFEKSLWSAIKPEFGILAKEMTLVSKKVLTGTDVKLALTELMKKYKSPSLQRSLNLIIGEVESGGKIADVIDRVIENLKKASILKQEMVASTTTYSIFMVAIVLFITPALFALAQQLLQIIIGVTKNIGVASTSASGMFGNLSFSDSSINPKDFKTFSLIAIGVISTFSSMIVSIISRGNVKSGVKYIPIFIAVSIVLFLLISNMLAGFFITIT